MPFPFGLFIVLFLVASVLFLLLGLGVALPHPGWLGGHGEKEMYVLCTAGV